MCFELPYAGTVTLNQRNAMNDRVFYALQCKGVQGPLLGAWSGCQYKDGTDAVAGKPEFPDCQKDSYRHPKLISPPGSQWERIW